MKTRFHTSPALLSIAAAMVLASAFVVSYGGTKLVQSDLLARHPLWPLLTLVLGVTAILLILTKGKAMPPFFDSKITGYLILAPMTILLAAALRYHAVAATVFLLPAIPCLWFALRAEDAAPGEGVRELHDFLGAGLLFLFGVLGFAFPMSTPFIPPISGLAVGLAIAPAAAFACWRAPEGKQAAFARIALGAAFMTLGVLAIAAEQPIYAVLYVPIALAHLCRPFIRDFRMGYEASSGLMDENMVVRSFEKIAELTAWSVFTFTLIHAYFNPPGLSGALFGLFVAAFVVFTIEYELIPNDRGTYVTSQRKSVANAVLLGVISHMTGGFQSPYVWFFILVLTSGAFVPNPRMILRRLGIIMGYYAIETAYSVYQGLLNETLVIDYLMVQIFVIGLTGVYVYRLAQRRRQIDEALVAKNMGLQASLERETSAKALVAKQAEDISRARKRDEAMLEALADGVIGISPKASIGFLNPSAEGLLGLTTEEVRGKRLRDLVTMRRDGDPDFRLGDYIDTALNGNAIPLPEDVYLQKPDGGKVYLSGTAVPVLKGKNELDGAILVFQDVSYLREVDQMKTGFLSVAAHQLRTPLSTIRWYLELLNDPSEGKLKKNQKMFAENAYLSLRKMVGLVNRLLAVTRLESGRVPFKPEPTDLKTMTRDILESLKRPLEERRLEIRTDLPDLPSVPLDSTLTREVMVNLVENAIRYTPDGGRITVSAKDEGALISWSVSDTGIGIPKAQQEKIFEKFYRASNAVEHSSEGSGLGLYLAQFIVSAWGGEISFTSEEGKGSTFRVTIPKSGMKSKEGHVSLNA